jgi:transposase
MGDQPVATIVLSLDTSDPHARRRLEVLYFTMFNLRRALQCDAQRLCREYWSRKNERDVFGWKFVAEDLGLNRKGFAALARNHARSSGWAMDHVSAALVSHMAVAVFEDVVRHLWSDNSGKRHGALRVTAPYKFTTIHGRARSHTTANKWETFRLYGTLEGHLDAYAHSGLGEHPTLVQVAALSAGTPVLRQSTMTTPGPTKWSTYTGPLVLVFAGGANSKEPELQLPVRLPQGRGAWDRVTHFLGDPETRHKIDLVRRQDSSQPRGWRYEMHLLVLAEGYVSPRNAALLEATPPERVACVDVNVSNLSVVSTSTDQRDLASTVVRADAGERDRLASLAAKNRRGARRVERSRRSTNTSQYLKSKAQTARDERRAARGLREVVTTTPGGGRVSRSDGVPLRAYWRDDLSASYRDTRRRQGEQARAQSVTKKIKAHEVAVQLVATHGVHWLIEDCNLTNWARLWGKSLHAFAPGMVTVELAALSTRHGGSFVKMATGPTALSSHCLCGRRASKDLSTRTHSCTTCGFSGDRDLVSAALGTCVVHGDVAVPTTARVDFARAATLLAAISLPTTPSTNGHQDALTSQTHPLVSQRRIDVVAQGARPAGYSSRAARLNARRTAQSTNGPGSARPAKVAHGPALGSSSPPGDLRLSS